MNEIRVWTKIISIKIFGSGHITIFISVFAVDDIIMYNERTLMICI